MKFNKSCYGRESDWIIRKDFEEFIRLLKEVLMVKVPLDDLSINDICNEIEELSNLNEDFPVTAGDIGNGEID